MPNDVSYETVDIQTINAKGYNVRVTPTLMVFVDGKLQDASSGHLRGDRLRAFLDRWGFSNRDQEDQLNDADLSDDLNPWRNPRRWEKGPIRDRIAGANTRFAWWLLLKWLVFTAGGIAIVFPWLVIVRQILRKIVQCDGEKRPKSSRTRRRPARSRPKSRS